MLGLSTLLSVCRFAENIQLMMGRFIFLWGMPGSGKSTAGPILAELLTVPFIDLDEKFEAEEGCTIAEFILKCGEDGFRKLEALYLKEIQPKEMTVIACGGGTPCFGSNARWMNQRGITVWLNTTPNILAKRLQTDEKIRPLLKNVNDLKALGEELAQALEIREVYYQKARFTVDAGREARLIANEIATYVR